MRPFDESGKLLAPYKAVGHSHGICQDGYMSSDPDALRCFSDDSKLYDPCWASGSKAVCLQDPWTPDAWLFDNPVIEPFERQPIGSTPWALELLDPIHHGKVLRCAFAGGTSDTIAAMRIKELSEIG